MGGSRLREARLADAGGLTTDRISRMYLFHCGSELAREERPDDEGIQAVRVIVDVHRRNAARSKLAPTGGSQGGGKAKKTPHKAGS